MGRRRLFNLSLLLVVPLFLTGCGLKKKPSATITPTPTTSGKVVTVGATATPGTVVGTGTSQSTTSTYLTIDPTSIDASIKENIRVADTKAKAWRADAKMVYFSAKIPSDLKVGQVTETYVYGSAGDLSNWWVITFSGKTNKMVRALTPKEDFLGVNYQAVPTQFWKTNYVEAFQIAEVNGGSQYRTAHPNAEIVVSLAVGTPRNYLWWSVDYKTEDSTDTFKIQINPSTKEVDATGAIGTPSSVSPSPAASPASTPKTQATTQATPSADPTIIEE